MSAVENPGESTAGQFGDSALFDLQGARAAGLAGLVLVDPLGLHAFRPQIAAVGDLPTAARCTKLSPTWMSSRPVSLTQSRGSNDLFQATRLDVVNVARHQKLTGYVRVVS